MTQRAFAAALTLLSLAASQAFAQSSGSSQFGDDEIVQEKNKVDLVDDANLDEAINRRPDLDYSNVSIDQENSSAKLTTIPSVAVQTVEVLKAATPDLDADTRGSILKVVYKPSYVLEGRVLEGRLYNRYKKIYNSIGPMGDVTYANRIGENGGVRITAEIQDIDRGSDRMNFDWSETDATSTGAPYLNRIDLKNSRRFYDTFRLNSSFDYRFSEGNDVYLRINYDRNRIHAISSVVQMRFGDETDFDALSPSEGVSGEGSIRRQGSRWNVENDSLSLTLGGKAKFNDLVVDWRIQQNENTETDPIQEDVRFDRDNANIGYRAADTAFPEVIFPENDEDGDNYRLVSYDRLFKDEQSNATIAGVDFRWMDGFLEENDLLKFGLKFSSQDLSILRKTDAYAINSEPEDILLSGFISGHRRDDFIGRGFSSGILPDAAAVGAMLTGQPERLQRDALLSALRSDPGSFDAQEDIFAAYAMINWQRNKLRIVGGIRYEDTQLSSSGNEVAIDGDVFEIRQRSASNSYGQFFPGLHAKYELSPRVNLFGSFTKTIKRPEFSDTAPFRVVDTQDREIEEGNPGLQPTLFDNFDFALDYKPNDDLLVSWELFYREITDTIFTNLSTLDSGTFTGYQLEQLRNGDAARQSGGKLLVRHRLEQFGTVFEPWSWSVAYAYTDSQAIYAQRPGEDLPVAGIPESELDAIISYESDKVFLQLGVDFRSSNLERVSRSDPSKDVYVSDFLWLNFKGEINLGQRVTAFIDWKNLLKEYEDEKHEGIIERPFRYKHDPWAILSGFRFNL